MTILAQAPSAGTPIAHDRATGSTIRTIEGQATWQALMARMHHPHLTQSYAFGEARRTNGWTPVRVLFERDGRPQAICQILERRFAGVRAFSRVSRGPLFFDEAPDSETITAVYRTLRRRWGRIGRGVLFVAPALGSSPAASAAIRAAGLRVRNDVGWVSAYVDLTPSEDDIMASFQPNFRNKLRKCEKLDIGLRIGNEPDLMEWMIARHEQNMREKGFSAADERFLRVLREASGPNFTILQAIHDGVPVAGLSLVRFARAAEYYIAWYGPEGRRINAGNFLLWEAIKHMKAAGADRLDLGGFDENAGYTTFKRGLRPHEYTLVGECVAW